jgi:hypothetical protein
MHPRSVALAGFSDRFDCMEISLPRIMAAIAELAG